jgi:hypothetical protein
VTNKPSTTPSHSRHVLMRNVGVVRLLEEFCMKYVVITAFAGILASLGSALFYLMRDKGTTNRTVNALTMRIGLSVALFIFVLFSYWMGWIKPTGLR